MRGAGAALVVAGCTATPEAWNVEISDLSTVVPGPGVPAEVVVQDANNNLAVTRHEGRVFLAFRTAPSHFASADTVLYVVSSEDERTWRFEGAFARGTDVREPQLVSTEAGLWLSFAELGTNLLDFEPQGTFRTFYEGPGAWTEPEPWGPEGFIPWRVKPLADGRWHLFGYVGGENIYDPGGEPVRVHWWTSDDGVDFAPAFGDGVVLEGGGSETDAVLLEDGSLVAVVRNESGDADGFGSKICTAPADDLGTWSCAADARKYDSPLLLQGPSGVWLVGRRTLGNDGAYDLGDTDLPMDVRALKNQYAYWQDPKRCSVWSVDPAARAVTWAADLPSKGDTCFPDSLDDGDDSWIVYNYTSDPEGPDVGWQVGQTGLTRITRQRVTVVPAP